MLYKKILVLSSIAVLYFSSVFCGGSKNGLEPEEDPLRRGLDLEEQTGGSPFASPSLSSDGSKGIFISYSTQDDKKGLMGFEASVNSALASSITSTQLIKLSAFNTLNSRPDSSYSIQRAFLSPDGEIALLSVLREDFKEQSLKQVYAFNWTSKTLVQVSGMEDGELEEVSFTSDSKAAFLRIAGKVESSSGKKFHYIYGSYIKDAQVQGFLIASQNTELHIAGIRPSGTADADLVLQDGSSLSGLMSYSFLAADLASSQAVEAKASQFALGQTKPSAVLSGDQKIANGSMLASAVASNYGLVHKKELLPLKKAILGNASSIEKNLDTEMIKSSLLLLQLDQGTQTSFTDYPGHIINRLSVTEDGLSSFASAVQSRRCKDSAGMDGVRVSSLGLFSFDHQAKSFDFIGISSSVASGQKTYAFTKEVCSENLENISSAFAVNPLASTLNFRMLVSVFNSKSKTPLLIEFKNNQAAIASIL